MTSRNSFDTRASLEVGEREYAIHSLPKLAAAGHDLRRLPYSLRILLENLLRHEDGVAVQRRDIEALAGWDPDAEPSHEIAFHPARVLLQDFTGVPALVDLAAMRDAMAEMGGDPGRINPQIPADLVIDHSVQVDAYGREAAFLINAEREYERNRERYAFLRWGQTAFDDFRVVPPDTGIVHQVNLEYLGRVVFGTELGGDEPLAYPDTLVGTDSHTTMINGLGVLGWGVGGIEAEAAVLGQPISMLIPQVVGFKLYGELPEGATATDLVLRVTEMLRERGVVQKFIEFYGDGIGSLSLADRATIGNMSPEYGATCAIFPIDEETLEYLAFTGRDPERVALVEAYAKEQRLFHEAGAPEAEYSDTLELDLATVEPSIAGPKLPQRRIPLSNAKWTFMRDLHEMFDRVELPDPDTHLHTWEEEGGDPEGAAVATTAPPRATVSLTTEEDGEQVGVELHNGSVVIAAITSCTNTSNPSVMIGAGLLARKAVERGLETKPWVKTSLAPGSMVVTEYLEEAGLMDDLEALGFHLVGYGCTTCIGNSGPLAEPISDAIEEHDLVACSVLSGNRNFEGRINPDTRANYLASPPLVVAYALAGRMDIDLQEEPIGTDAEGEEVYLADIWPSQREIRDTIRSAVKTEQFTEKYADVFEGDERWHALEIPEGDRFDWPAESTYIRRPTFLTDVLVEPPPLEDIEEARVLALLGDSVTTDHISPAGSIAEDSPAARYLMERGVEPKEFNSYGSRRGNHEVMVRGTFANIRLRNRLVEREGGWTRHLPSGEEMTIFDAAERYAEEDTPLIVIAGKEYGSGSSRDWAAKGTLMLGVRAVIADGYERIHRSNLIGMGVLPLQFGSGENAASLGLTGEETYAIRGIAEGLRPGKRLPVEATKNGAKTAFSAIVRIDTPVELEYFRHGGILQYVLRQLRGG